MLGCLPEADSVRPSKLESNSLKRGLTPIWAERRGPPCNFNDLRRRGLTPNWPKGSGPFRFTVSIQTHKRPYTHKRTPAP